MAEFGGKADKKFATDARRTLRAARSKPDSRRCTISCLDPRFRLWWIERTRGECSPVCAPGGCDIMTTTNGELLSIARELPLPVPWDRGQFIDSLAELRGRPITLIPTDTASLAGSPCGLWLAREHDDLIIHEASTSEYHIDQIVCHEIGHMVLGHDRLSTLALQTEHNIDLCRAVMPDIDADTIRAVLGRSDFTPEYERDAERFASIVLIAAAERAEQRSPLMRSVFRRST